MSTSLLWRRDGRRSFFDLEFCTLDAPGGNGGVQGLRLLLRIGAGKLAWLM
jgi:hypothetical protein